MWSFTHLLICPPSTPQCTHPCPVSSVCQETRPSQVLGHFSRRCPTAGRVLGLHSPASENFRIQAKQPCPAVWAGAAPMYKTRPVLPPALLTGPPRDSGQQQCRLCAPGPRPHRAAHETSADQLPSANGLDPQDRGEASILTGPTRCYPVAFLVTPGCF